jgi:acetyl esterase/lipase
MQAHRWRLCGALVLAAGLARAQPFEPQIAARLVDADRYPRDRAAFPGGVRALPDLVYSSPPGFGPLTLDLYLPPAPSVQPRPLVVYIHGGAWQGGSKRASGAFADWPLALASLAARGYVVASIDYRLAPHATFPAQIVDVKEALRWLRSKAGAYGIDRSRVLVWGAEAGGHLAALAAASCGAAGLERLAGAAPPHAGANASAGPRPADESACAQAAVVWYGAADLVRMRHSPAADSFLGCAGRDCDPQRRLASPVSYIDPGVPPFLVIHGMEDLAVPVDQAAVLNDAIRARGGSVELILLPGVGHGFVGRTPDATREASKRAWARTVDFISRMTRARAP